MAVVGVIDDTECSPLTEAKYFKTYRLGRANTMGTSPITINESAQLIFLDSDTCTVVAWQTMNLVNDISKSETHFLAITLRRNLASNNVRSMYKFEDMAVLPLTVLQEKFANLGTVGTGTQVTPMDPMQIVTQNRVDCIRQGGLGGVLVMSVELTNGERKSPEQAVREVCSLLYLLRQSRSLLTPIDVTDRCSCYAAAWLVQSAPGQIQLTGECSSSKATQETLR